MNEDYLGVYAGLLMVGVIALIVWCSSLQTDKISLKNERDCLAGIMSSCNQNSEPDDPIETPETLKIRIQYEYGTKDSKNKKAIIILSKVVCIKGYKWLQDGDNLTQMGKSDDWGDLQPIPCGGAR